MVANEAAPCYPCWRSERTRAGVGVSRRADRDQGRLRHSLQAARELAQACRGIVQDLPPGLGTLRFVSCCRLRTLTRSFAGSLVRWFAGSLVRWFARWFGRVESVRGHAAATDQASHRGPRVTAKPRSNRLRLDDRRRRRRERRLGPGGALVRRTRATAQDHERALLQARTSAERDSLASSSYVDTDADDDVGRIFSWWPSCCCGRRASSSSSSSTSRA